MALPALFLTLEITMSKYVSTILNRVWNIQQQAEEMHEQWSQLDPHASDDDYETQLWLSVTICDLPDLIMAESLLLIDMVDVGCARVECDNVLTNVTALANVMGIGAT